MDVSQRSQLPLALISDWCIVQLVAARCEEGDIKQQWLRGLEAMRQRVEGERYERDDVGEPDEADGLGAHQEAGIATDSDVNADDEHGEAFINDDEPGV